MPRRELAWLLALTPGGCTTEDVTVLPAVEVHVRTAAGEAVAGARVLIQAEQQPYGTPLDPLAIAVTDHDGTARFEALSERVTQQLWLMHGVTAYSHEYCVEHPLHGVDAGRLDRHDALDVVLAGKDRGGVCIREGSRLQIDRP